MSPLFPAIFSTIIVPFLIQSPWQHEVEASIDDKILGNQLREILEKLFNEEWNPVVMEVCSKSLEEVIKWLNKTSIEDGERQIVVSLADFNNSVNLTEHNKNKAVEEVSKYENWLLQVSIAAIELMEIYRKQLSICGDPWMRMLQLYKMNGYLIPSSNEKQERLNKLTSEMDFHYSTSVVIKNNKKYRLEPELTSIMRDSRDFFDLMWAWQEWHNVAADNKLRFKEMADLMNEAAVEHGFEDASDVWKYDDVESFDSDVMMMKIMKEVKPFYDQIHAFVRWKLIEIYYPQVNGTSYEELMDLDGPIPAHLFGNMWAQQWDSIGDLLVPFPEAPPPPNITSSLINQNYNVNKMFKLSEEFFVSLGFQPMTDIFWKKSVTSRPDDPNIEMVCHASAYDMTAKDDYRIKMCTAINAENMQTVHHEMGHIAYYMEYRHQPTIFRSGGTPAFHEAVGDTIALSVMSPSHLKTIGLMEGSEVSLGKTSPSVASGGDDHINDEAKDFNDDDDDEEVCNDSCKIKINKLMRTALEKVTFLPFALSLEFWRYGVFNGEISADEYNKKWWEIRRRFQGIVPPVDRSEDMFDAGAKYHIVSNTPYARYFYSFIVQFQFHEALCKESGFTGELYDCDIYKSKTAGEKLRSMLSRGNSIPWQRLMKDMTGQEEFSAKSMLEYFKPLYDWLIQANCGRNVGW